MNENIWNLLTKALAETGIMISWSLVISIIAGGIIGLFLYLTSNPLFVKNRIINTFVGIIINVIRSVPFLILLILLLPM